MRRECVCWSCLLLFPGGWGGGEGHNVPQAAADRVAAHSAPAVKEAVRSPLSPMDRWGLPSIPLNTRRGLPWIRPSTGGGAHCYRCVWFFGACSFFWGGAKTDETSTRSAGTGGGAGC